MGLPTSWTDALERLGRCLDGGEGRAEAQEWLRQVVETAYGVESLRELDRAGRLTAFQRTCGVVLAAEETGWPDEVRDGETGALTFWYRDGSVAPVGEGELIHRDRLARIFARYFGGVAVDGPPWRLSDAEDDRPTYEEWAAMARF